MHPLTSTPETLTLEDVKIRFESWRSTRKQDKERIPTSLRKDAFSLVGRYPKMNILKELRLNTTQLNSFGELSEASQSSPSPQKPTFLEVSLSPLVPCRIELHHPGGTILRLESINEQQFSTLLQTFLSCSR